MDPVYLVALAVPYGIMSLLFAIELGTDTNRFFFYLLFWPVAVAVMAWRGFRLFMDDIA
jgi:hypothetical protein